MCHVPTYNVLVTGGCNVYTYTYNVLVTVCVMYLCIMY